LAGKIAQNAHREGEFLYFGGATDINIVCDVDPRGSHPPNFFLITLFTHADLALIVVLRVCFSNRLPSPIQTGLAVEIVTVDFAERRHHAFGKSSEAVVCRVAIMVGTFTGVKAWMGCGS
jgi:hypothetical protein